MIERVNPALDGGYYVTDENGNTIQITAAAAVWIAAEVARLDAEGE